MERVRILLRTRNDVYPSPAAKAIPSTPAGPAPMRTRKCEPCRGKGSVRGQQCPHCEGLGRLAYDSYTGRVAGSDARKPDPMTPARTEAELQRLSLSLKLSEGEIDPNEAYGWERAIERRDRGASYRELSRALERLRSEDGVGWDFIVWIYGCGLEVELTPGAKAWEERLVARLAELMPSRIRIPKHLYEELKERKRLTAISLSQEGLEVSEIADAVLLPEHVVQQFIGKSTIVRNTQ